MERPRRGSAESREGFERTQELVQRAIADGAHDKVSEEGLNVTAVYIYNQD